MFFIMSPRTQLLCFLIFTFNYMTLPSMSSSKNITFDLPSLPLKNYSVPSSSSGTIIRTNSTASVLTGFSSDNNTLESPLLGLDKSSHFTKEMNKQKENDMGFDMESLNLVKTADLGNGISFTVSIDYNNDQNNLKVGFRLEVSGTLIFLGVLYMFLEGVLNSDPMHIEEESDNVHSEFQENLNSRAGNGLLEREPPMAPTQIHFEEADRLFMVSSEKRIQNVEEIREISNSEFQDESDNVSSEFQENLNSRVRIDITEREPPTGPTELRLEQEDPSFTMSTETRIRNVEETQEILTSEFQEESDNVSSEIQENLNSRFRNNHVEREPPTEPTELHFEQADPLFTVSTELGIQNVEEIEQDPIESTNDNHLYKEDRTCANRLGDPSPDGNPFYEEIWPAKRETPSASTQYTKPLCEEENWATSLLAEYRKNRSNTMKKVVARPSKEEAKYNVASLNQRVPQKRATAVSTGKRDISVRALKVAKIAKRHEQKMENEHRMKKEAFKLEIAARKRQDQEDERMLQMAMKRKDRSGAMKKVYKKSRVKVELVKPICQENSYNISPYQSIDYAVYIPTNKFVPSWASNNNIAMALQGQQKLDPERIFSVENFCSMDEVLLPWRPDQTSSDAC